MLQWQLISLWGVVNSYAQMEFEGSLTQWHVCDAHPTDEGCEDANQSSEDGFTQLWDAVNSTPATETYIGWRTDVTKAWEDGAPPPLDD